ncbi:hypothetical protein [Rhizobium sp. TRM95796]|uniref:hypothetical protein n=1 Tax=Rhizobium sp. TRM95796 TaxID=2979862 RepID=UPI0021E95D69|nr:hypothetical protein [Rhizobium sp. TRM95796]MCV3765691.1 hypothetical protein [Rhizobium sp. TRM95796]
MPGTAYRSFVRGRNHGHLRRYVQSVKSSGCQIHRSEASQPAADLCDPAVADLAPHEDLHGGRRVSRDTGGGWTDMRRETGNVFTAPAMVARIAPEAWRSSNLVLHPVFRKRQALSPVDCGRALGDPTRPSNFHRARSAQEGRP